MSDYEIAVVGAGPAGCTVARELGTKHGVLLLDAKELPRSKPCGGALNPWSWRFLKNFGVPESLMLDPRSIHFRFVDWDRRITRKTTLEFRNVKRDKFDEWLLDLVPHSVDILSKAALVGIAQKNGGVALDLSRNGSIERITAGYVVGADGPHSRTRLSLGRDIERYMAVQDWLECGKTLPPYFDCIGTSKISPDFAYAYIMPKGEYALIGSVFYPGATHIKQKHRLFLQLVRESNPDLGESVKQEAALAVRMRSANDLFLGEGRILLAGESAGFISPTSGEGISYALSSGEACARALADRNEGALRRYERLASPISTNIRNKMRKLPIISNRYLQRFIDITPPGVLSRIVEKL